MVVKKKESNTQNNSSQVLKQNLQKEFFSLMMTYWNQRNPHLICERITEENIKLAKLLSIQATSVSRERLFSKAGLVITNRRTCLEQNFAEQLVFLRHNLRQ